MTVAPNLNVAASVVKALGLDEGATRWADNLASVGKPPYRVVLPSTEETKALLSRLGVPDRDANEVATTLPSPAGSPEWWWLLERSSHLITKAMGTPDTPHLGWPGWVGSEEAYPSRQRCFMAHLFLATMPHTLAWHRSRGIPEEISWASMADLGRHMAIHRRTYGATGVDAPWWVALCLRAEVFDLGRLQYNWFRLGVADISPPWYPAKQAQQRGEGFEPGDLCVGVHIPESGPLTPAACNHSFEMARAFFSEYFPLVSQKRRLATCWSWLLDEQLAAWLPAESNIVSFQRRFQLVPGGIEDDKEILEFVFRKPDASDHLDALPQRTSLEKSVVAHLKAGGHWRTRTGWLDL